MYMTFSAIEPILTACGGSVRASSTHIARKMNRSELIETVAGSAREFTRENTMEMAFASALIKGGAKTSAAFAFANGFQTMFDFSEEFPEWFVFPAGDLNRAVHSDKINLKNIQRELGAFTLSIVNVRAIKKMVDDLYEAG